MRILIAVAIAVMFSYTPAYALLDTEIEILSPEANADAAVIGSGNSSQSQIGVNENENTNFNTNFTSSDSDSTAIQGQGQDQGQQQGQVGINEQQMGQQMGQGQIGSVNVDSHDEATFIPAATTHANVGQGGMAVSSPIGGVAITTSEQGKLNMDNINTLIVLFQNGIIDQATFIAEAKGQWEQMKAAAKPKLLLGILPIQGNPILDLISFRFGWGNGKKHERVDTELVGNLGYVN